MAVGVSGYMAVYDLQSNTRIGRVDLMSLPVEMAFAPDGSVIVVVVQDWYLYSVSTTSWKARVVVPRRNKMDKPLESCLLAVTPGHNPLIYFCRYAKDTLRLSSRPVGAGGGAAAGEGTAAGGGGRGGGSSGSTSSWGVKVKLDGQRAILGLACHHVDAQLLVLTADGQLRGYSLATAGGETLTPLFAVQVQDPSDKVVPPAGVLLCVPHPSLPVGALILQGSRLGTVAVLEAPGRSAPTALLRTRIPGSFSVVGMGVCRNTGVVLAFGLNEGGRLRCTTWRLSYRPGAGGVALRPSRVEPQDLTPLLDSTRRSKALLASSMTFSASGAAANTIGGALGGGAFGGAGAGGAGGSAAAAVQAASAMCHGLWGLSPSWSQELSSSFLLESQLGPSAGHVVVHPGLGLVAVAPEPPRAAALKDVMFTGRGALSVEEAALARRTSSVSLLLVSNLEAHSGGWRGARVAPQHTPLTAWLPPHLQHQLQQHQPQQGQTQLAGTAAAAPAAAAAPGDSSDDEQEQQPPASPSGTGGAGAAAAGPARAGAGGAGPPVEGLALPPHVYYLAGSRLMKYSLVSRSSSPLAQLPVEAPDGDVRTPRQLLHSAKRGAWLVFFESGAGGAGGGGGVSGGGAGGGPDPRFTWGLINAPSFVADGALAVMSWLRPGKSGCFLGPDDAHFAIMSSNGKLLEVYDTGLTPRVGGGAGVAPLLSVTLEGAAPLPGLGSPVFPGPPMTNAPVPEARAPPEAPPHDVRRFRGCGVVIWQSADNALSLTTLPALVRVPLEPLPALPPEAAPNDSDSDDGAGQPYYPSLPSGHHFGSQPRQAHLPLLLNETVLHVAWQSLAMVPPSTQAVGGAAGSGSGPADAVAAVLTSQRLMLVTAGLRLVCAVNLQTHGSPALLEPLSSVMWAGPMLLASTAGGQVLQLTWTGALLPVATVSPTGHCALLGVTGDAMLLLRTPLVLPPAAAGSTAGGGAGGAATAALAEAIARPAALLQPLIIGWASLAATGLLSYSPSATVVRPALKYVFGAYDGHSVTPRGVWALISAGAWDVAAAVAAHMPPLDSSVKLAAAAAAGNWSAVQATLLGEASRALHAPAPPPRGSELHSKLVAAAAGALFHGQLSAAGTLFQAAGEWPAAMLLAVCQGHVEAVSAISHKLTTAATMTAAAAGGMGIAPPGGGGGFLLAGDTRVASQLAAALRNVYGGVGTPVEDLKLALTAAGGPGHGPAAESLDRAERWSLALPSVAPAAFAVLGGLPRAAVHDNELGAVPSSLDRASVVSYYGLTALAAASVSASAGARTPVVDRSGPAAGTVSVKSGGSVSIKPGGSTTAGDVFDRTSVSSSEIAQNKARDDFNAFGRGLTHDFDSDDSDSETTGSAAEGGVGGAQRRIKIQIRDHGGAGGPAAAAGDTSLRDAAKGLRLVPPVASGGALSKLAPPASFGNAAAPPPLAATASGASNASGQLTPSGASIQFPPGMSSIQLYTGGVAHMESGDWRSAAAHFSRAMSVLQHEERTSLDDAARRARLAFCAQYYAAVRLLEAVGSESGPREARLYRYLAGLNLDPKHSTALLREAISRNRAVGNYRYAGDQLTALIGRVADTAPGEYLAQLQAEIEECDRHGGRNSSLPKDEQVADWAVLVASAGDTGRGKEELDLLVVPLLR